MSTIGKKLKSFSNGKLETKAKDTSNLHALDIYIRKIGVVDHCVIGTDAVSYHQKVIATFNWEDNIPIFNFHNDIPYGPKVANLKESQYFRKPYLDHLFLYDNIEYLAQEVRKAISLDESMFLIWKRDVFHDAEPPKEIKDKIVQTIKSQYLATHLQDEEIEGLWLHLGNCAVYNLQQRSDMHKIIVVDNETTGPAERFTGVNRYKAFLQSDSRRFAVGNTSDAAIGNLIRSNSEIFDVQVEWKESKIKES